MKDTELGSIIDKRIRTYEKLEQESSKDELKVLYHYIAAELKSLKETI